MEQALTCPLFFIRVLLVSSEDLGGDSEVGPSSIWELGEVTCVDGVNDAQRGAAFTCSLTGADQRRPLGLLTNQSSFKSKMSRGWPSLYLVGQDLQYHGPLVFT